MGGNAQNKYFSIIIKTNSKIKYITVYLIIAIYITSVI
jgi:hypothetical protein